MKRLLIVYHTQFGATAQMAEAARDGALAIDDVDTLSLRAADAGVAELLAADALLVATSENFGGMAGMVKDFLERTFYPCEGQLEGPALCGARVRRHRWHRRDARRRSRRDRAGARARCIRG